jgi:outer membrane protein assembly factor BamB
MTNLRRPLTAILTAATLVAAGYVLAADWPQWRGPERNGISKETGLLKAWPKEGPKLLWQVNDIGYGYSTPAVVGDRLYLVSNEGMDNEFVQALDVQTGKRIWSQRIGNVGAQEQKPNYTGARSTPTVDGEFLYVFSSDGDLACLAADTGKVRWQKNVRTEFGGEPGIWAYAESPLVDGDVVVCAPGGKDASLLAVNKKTGEMTWKTAVPGGGMAGYASTIVVEATGIKQYVQFLKQGLVGVDAKTGNFLWHYGKTADTNVGMNMQTPIAADGLIYCAARPGSGVVRLKADNGGVAAEQVYMERGLPNAIGGAVQVGGYLYGTSGGELVCAEFSTGTVKWRDGCVGNAAICYADGCLYIRGEDGEVALVEASPKAFVEKDRFTPPAQPKHVRGPQEKAWSYPVVANGRFYIHDVGTIWCYDVKKSPPQGGTKLK